MMKTPIRRLRMAGFYEGVSYLLLLGIAMPLKYFADVPEAVRVVGTIHGLLFILYMLALAHVTIAHRWSILQVLGAVIASLVPFGTFVLDARLRRQR